jgi:hypothetical protein
MMFDPLFDPIPVRYNGLYADNHFVDAQQFGKSVVGASKLSNSICHFIFSGQVTHDPRSYSIRFFVGPSKESGYLQELFALAVSGQLPLFNSTVIGVAKILTESILDAIVKDASGRKPEMRDALATIASMAESDREISKQLLNGNLQNQHWMQTMIEELALEGRSALRDTADPVGKSVRTISIGDRPSAITIDEPVAVALRSRGEIAVGESATYPVKFEGVFKTSGACRVRLLDYGIVVPGKITDPAVANDVNLYTRALADGTELIVTAKPTLKDGIITKLFISDVAVIHSQKG